LTPEKGIDLLLKTWRAAALPQLRIIGDGPLREDVVAFVAANPDAGVEYLGRRSHDEVIDEMKRAGALVIPSLWYEAFPHTILEASACGVPIIASRLGTLPDVIDDEITGLLFEPGKSTDLAAKVRAIFSQDGGPALREKLGAGARAKFLREYTADHAYELLLQIYESAIGGRTPVRSSRVPARS
jgi:glycosyltransferase involved in cell wall biosynthesis